MVPMKFWSSLVVRPGTHSPSSGFSVIESLLALTIAAILGAVTIALSTQSRQRSLLNHPAVTFAGWLEEIAQQTQRTLVSCTITVSTGTVSSNQALAVVSPSACSITPSFRIPRTGGRDLDYTISTFPSTSSTWTFLPRGAVTNTTDIQVVFTLPNAVDVRCVRIGAVFGQIQLGWTEVDGQATPQCTDF
jgi:type II secretory pathway pseudopilin PulG